ncbi:hypothetical protein PFWH6_1231 [Pseudomonas fluorescens WH6]|nr:hypothetical protein PFWH6_1231 [Pseudomonas fluorescens WH6]
MGELDCKRHGAVLRKGADRRSGPAWTSEKKRQICECGRCGKEQAPPTGDLCCLKSLSAHP